MRLYCLNGDANYPCFVLTGKGCTLMLDCSLNMSGPLKHFIPQTLVQNQRFESMPNYRHPSTGVVYDQLKEFNNRVYLNMPLEFSTPQFDLINVEDIDAVLISSYSFMLALPYLTRMPGFRAQVYCTEPVMHFGRMLMEDLVANVKNDQTVIMVNNEKFRQEQLQKAKSASKYPIFSSLENLSLTLKNAASKEGDIGAADLVDDDVDKQPATKQPRLQKIEDVEMTDLRMNSASPTANMASSQADTQLATSRQTLALLSQLFNIADNHLKPINWSYLYTREDVDLCMSKIKLVGYNERINLYGSVNLQPRSSGHSIGSCNWTIEFDCDTIVYLSRSSLLNTHAKLFNNGLLKQQLIDALIVTGLNQAQSVEPEQAIQDFCKACIMTIKNQGNVLIPVLPTGKIYDLVECLYRHLSDASLQTTPVYFLSSLADQSLAFSSIFAEWLCDMKQSLVYSAESPFLHAELTKIGHLKCFPEINAKFNDEFHQPCILFASHPSLRFGETCHFVELWKNSPANSFIFTDAEFNYLDALAPYQPVYANYYYFPIDTSLSSQHINKLLKEPKYVGQVLISRASVASSESSTPTASSNNDPAAMNSAKIDASKLPPYTRLTTYGQNDIVKLELQRKYENCDIDADLASIIMLTTSRKTTTTTMTSGGAATVASGAAGKEGVLYQTFNAQLVTKNNHHTLRAAPKTIPLTRRDRINEASLKKYPYGKLNLDRLVSLLKQSGLANIQVVEKQSDITENMELDETGTGFANSNMYLIEIDAQNRIDVDINSNKIDVVCENEEFRLKIKDSLLKCFKAF